MEQDLVLIPCCKCGKIPTIKKETGGLYYVICSCRNWDRYEFLGVSEKGVIERWNEGNRPILRKGNPRYKDEM